MAEEFTPSDVQKLLAYDAETGTLTWKPRAVRPGRLGAHDRAWNTSHSGKVTGGANQFGYPVVQVGGRPRASHRLIWAIVHGRWPTPCIDHINGDRADNRLVNLREATNLQNRANATVRSDSKVGVKGVQFHPQTGKWRARIRVDGKQKSLGLYESVEAAAKAYAAESVKQHGEFAFASREAIAA
jgi:hypothetical protein